MRLFLFLLLAALPCLLPAQSLAPPGGERLWGGLFWCGPERYAGDPDASESPETVLSALRTTANPATEPALIGHDEVDLPGEWFTWVRFSEEFFLRVERGGQTASGQLVVDVQFWQQEQLLLSTSVTLSEDRPLIIRGPAWRGGHLYATLALAE